MPASCTPGKMPRTKEVMELTGEGCIGQGKELVYLSAKKQGE